jgi:hypothetical protein
VALRGSLLNSAQWLVNKAFTAGAMLVIAYFLTPGEYGVGVQSLAICQFLCVFLPLTVGDVLIAHPKRFALLAPSASGLALIIACATAVVTLLSIPFVVHFYGDYPAGWLIGLLAALAVKPILEARLMLPLSAMRLELAYPRIAFIDGMAALRRWWRRRSPRSARGPRGTGARRPCPARRASTPSWRRSCSAPSPRPPARSTSTTCS